MREQLVDGAKALRQPDEQCTLEFKQKRDQLAARGNQILGQRPDLEKLVGKGNAEMAEDNNRNFARFMESMFAHYDPEILVETVLWVFRAYRSHGFRTTYWAANIDIWVEMLKDELSTETYASLYPFYNWLIVNIPVFVKLTDEAISAPDAS